MLALLPKLALLVPLAFGAPASPSAGERAEVARIQRHFDGAIALLAQRDLSGLTTDQRARRAALTRVLRTYRDRGLFPRNYDFPGDAMPYFIDRRTGVLCAVAHLLESSGRRDLVDAVADADNNVWVPELAGNAKFEAWLDANGLTIEEAARIQVPYIGDPVDDTPPFESRASAPLTATPLFVNASAIAALEFFPKLKTSRAGALLTVAAGTYAAISADQGFRNGDSPTLAGVTLASGLLNYYIAGRTYSRYRTAERTRRASISPIIPATRDQGAGLQISFTF